MRPRLVLLPLIQILSGAVQAQALPGIDSLRNVAFNAGLPDSVRLSALNAGLEPWFQAGLPDSAIAWAAEGLRIARSGTNADRTVGWMKLLGTMHGRSGDLTRSRELLFQALEHRPMPKDPTMLPRVRLNVAVSYQIEGAFSAALEHAHKALKELEPVGDSAGVAHACILIGSLHIDSDHALSAAPYLKRALAIQEAAGDPRARNALVGLARVALVRGDTTAALQLYDRALSISKDIGDLESCALISLNRAEVHIKRTELSRAAEILDSAAAFHRDPMVDIRMQLLRCEILVLQDRYHDALDGLQRLIAQAEPLHLLVQLETAHLLRSQVLEAIGDHHGALVEYKRSQQLGDSILSQEQVRKLSDIELSSRFQREQQADSLRHLGELQARTQEVERQRFARNAILGGLVLVGIIAALLTWLLVASRRNSARLNDKNQAILAAQQQVVEAEKQRENESVRTRIARDIHDDIGSGLTKIAMLSNEAKHKVQVHAEELHATLDRITTHSRTVSAALSDIVWSVDPAQDSSAELVHHASHVAHRLLDDAGMRHVLSFEHTEPGHPVSPSAKHHVVMVMKEAINNALKYAEAQRITVRLTAGAGRFELLVQDDGKGFDPKAMGRSGNGLRNMQARAEALGARLDVRSAPGQGCAVRLEGTLA